MFGELTLWGRPRSNGFGFPIERELQRLLGDLLGGDNTVRDQELSGFAPRINVADGDKEVRVTAELPGVEEKDIQVSLGPKGLSITGEKKQETEEKGKNFYRFERSYGSFHRLVPLPENVESDKADASFKKGVLSVVVPKRPGTFPRKIDVKSS